MTAEPPPQPAHGASSLSRMPNPAFERVAVANAFPRTRNFDTWELMLSRSQINRTRAVLVAVLERHLGTVRKRNANPVDETQRSRDANFTETIKAALAEVNAAIKEYNRANSAHDVFTHRAVIGELVRAVQAHQEACIESDEPADAELWAVLDTVTVPYCDEWVPVREFAELPAPKRPATGGSSAAAEGRRRGG